MENKIIYLPYVTKTIKTTVNGVTVWHSNILINLWLKIKFFFYTPKTLKNFKKYSTKNINVGYDPTLKINNIK